LLASDFYRLVMEPSDLYDVLGADFQIPREVEVRFRICRSKAARSFNDADRALIVDQCRHTAESQIVITHGTDTMVETARALAEALGTAKTIVLTGAMVPYAFGSSDGLFNLGSALSFVQLQAPGVYIAMNGRLFIWNQVTKNKQTGVFEAK